MKTTKTKAARLFQRTPGANYTFRISHTEDGRRRQSWISTGTNILAAAKVEAARLLKLAKEAKRQGRWELLGMAKLRADLPTLTELQTRYEERIRLEAARPPKPAAISAYFRHLRTIISTARGSAIDPDQLTIAAIAGPAGAEVVKAFRAAWLAKAADPASEATRRRSGDSMLSQARAIFSRAAMRCFAGWSMPDLRPFMETPGFDSARRQHIDIDPATLRAMDKAAERLADTNPRLYIIHIAHKYLALRNSEIAEARCGWFLPVRWTPDRPVQWMLEISGRLGFTPKASEGSVPVCSEIMRRLVRAWTQLGIDPQAAPAAHIIPAADPTERYDLIYREHAAFIRRFLPREDFGKAGYELRRFAFRTIMAKHGSREAARAFLRHAMPADAARAYQARFYHWQTLGNDLGITPEDATGGAAAVTAPAPDCSAWDALN